MTLGRARVCILIDKAYIYIYIYIYFIVAHSSQIVVLSFPQTTPQIGLEAINHEHYLIASWMLLSTTRRKQSSAMTGLCNIVRNTQARFTNNAETCIVPY